MRTGKGEWEREGVTLVEEREVKKFPSLKHPSVHRVIKTYTVGFKKPNTILLFHCSGRPYSGANTGENAAQSIT